MTFVRPKFDDCKSCVFFLKNRRNPICGECDSGEFFEEKVRIREKTNHELMKLFGEQYDDE
ncbi:hypothetical protein EV128_12557 [Rhizobium azibense]|nr:hypothetical protein EV128_12557 [Rhizobium azibense]